MRRQQKRSHDVRSFCFCRHLCTVLSPATSHCSNGTRLLTGSPSPAAGGRKRGAVSRKKYKVQRPLQGQLHDNISDRSQVREHLSLCYFCTTTSSTGSSCSYLAVTLLSLRDISPVRGNLCLRRHKRRVILIQYQSYSSLLLSHTPCCRSP